MICFPLDNTPYEAKDMGAYLATRTRGVFSADNNLAVTPGSGMSVSVSAGLAWLKWSEYWGTAVLQEQDMTLQIDAADGVLKRIDAIACRLDKVNNAAEIVVKKGAYASNPIVSAPDQNSSYDEIYLATILVGAGITEISTSAITDQRMNQNYCGLMRDGVTGIPTAQMQEQVQAIIKNLEDTIAGIEGGSGFVFSLSGKSGHLTLEDIGAQPQTAARSSFVKADDSGNLVAGTVYQLDGLFGCGGTPRTAKGAISLSGSLNAYDLIAVITAPVDNGYIGHYTNLYFPVTFGLSTSQNIWGVDGNTNTLKPGNIRFGYNGSGNDSTKLYLTSAPGSCGIYAVYGVKFGR